MKGFRDLCCASLFKVTKYPPPPEAEVYPGKIRVSCPRLVKAVRKARKVPFWSYQLLQYLEDAE